MEPAHPSSAPGWTSEAVGWDGCSLVTALAVQPREDGGTQVARQRARVGRRPATTVPCQIDGCGAELVGEKGYYRRYRICREHCSTLCILLEGREMRFCRPCGRLHLLQEFDLELKSCRRMLRISSERRRKPADAGAAKGSSEDTTKRISLSASPEHEDGNASSRSDPPSKGSGSAGSVGAERQVRRRVEGAGAQERASLDLPHAESAALDLDDMDGELDPEELGLGDAFGDFGPGLEAGLDEPPFQVLDIDDEALLDLLRQDVADGTLAPFLADDDGGAAAAAVGSSLPDDASSPSSNPVPSPGPLESPALTYAPDILVARVSMKIFGCTPEMLIPDVKAGLERMIGMGPILLDGSIRPGCLHLIVNVLMDRKQEAALCSVDGLQACLHFLTSATALADWRSVVVQAASLVGVTLGRQAPLRQFMYQATLPAFQGVLPLCTLPGNGQHALQGVDMLGLPGTQLHCRQQGRNLTMDLLCRGGGQGQCGCREAAQAGPELYPRDGCCCPVTLIRGLALGFADMEVQLGRVMSAPRAILVLPDPQAVLEVRTLELSSAGIPDVDAFLRNTGLVVQYLYRHQIPGGERFEPLYRPELLRRLEAMAQTVVVAALARGWPALSRLLLPATTAGGSSASAALSCMDALCPSSSLVDLAASTGSDESLAALVEWASAEGVDVGVAAKAAGPSRAAPSKPGALQRAAPAAGGGTRAEFVAEFHRQRLWHEAVHEVVTLTILAVGLHRLWRAEGWVDPQTLLLMAAVFLAPAAALVLLAYRRSPWLLRWRSFCVPPLRLARSVSVFVVSRHVFDVEVLHSVVMPAAPWRFAVYLLRVPLLVVMGTVGHACPFAANMLAAVLYALPCLSYLPGRCARECGVAGQGGRYGGILQALEGAHHLAGWRSGPPTEELPPCTHSCLAVHGWLLLYIGTLLPVWVGAVLERQAWRRWQGRPARPSAALMLLHACGMALASSACLLLAERVAAALGSSY